VLRSDTLRLPCPAHSAPFEPCASPERWAKVLGDDAEGPTFDVSSVAPNVVEIRINFEEDFVATVYLFVLVYLGHSVSL